MGFRWEQVPSPLFCRKAEEIQSIFPCFFLKENTSPQYILLNLEGSPKLLTRAAESFSDLIPSGNRLIHMMTLVNPLKLLPSVDYSRKLSLYTSSDALKNTFLVQYSLELIKRHPLTQWKFFQQATPLSVTILLNLRNKAEGQIESMLIAKGKRTKVF